MFERIVPIDDTANGGYRVSLDIYPDFAPPLIIITPAYQTEGGQWRACSNNTPIYLYPAEARALAAALLAAADEAEEVGHE